MADQDAGFVETTRLLGADKNDVVTPEMAILEEKAHSTIMLCLADDVITEVSDEETAAGLWLKLESCT